MIYINNFELMRNRDYRLKPKLSIFSAGIFRVLPLQIKELEFFFLLQIGVICGVDHEDLKSINIISKSKEEPKPFLQVFSTGTCKTVTPRINSQMIIVFPGSPIKYEKNSLEEVGKKFKKNSVALRIVNF
ncbi:unnamed protein product [Brassica rapa]|uniref:Uncharacterized protein n=1 Tax=Brassica campestris TaxID=3711 RepID=A0A3P6A9N7_BRACM|nr:unnamed protein product [Brassica rapa]VDC84174.1 unnamed protein product [Brassica rapa]